MADEPNEQARAQTDSSLPVRARGTWLGRPAEQERAPGEGATRAEAMSAAAINQDEIEVLVVTRTTRQAFLIGPVAANSLIWLLKQAIDEMEA